MELVDMNSSSHGLRGRSDTMSELDLSLSDVVKVVEDSESPPGSPLPPFGVRTWSSSKRERAERQGENVDKENSRSFELVHPLAKKHCSIPLDLSDKSREKTQEKEQQQAKEHDQETQSTQEEERDDDEETTQQEEEEEEEELEEGEDDDEIRYASSSSSLLERVRILEQENSRLRLENVELKKKESATLSPAVYQVHGPKQVRRMRLGRTASISTRQELFKLSSGSADLEENESEESSFLSDLLSRMSSLVSSGALERECDYLRSAAFAHQLMELCWRASKVLREEKRVLDLASPLYVFGDFHGNMEDLRFFSENIFPMGMRLTAGAFLFLGDYVDRGAHGLELLAFLLAQKLQAPDKVFLIRGNHETRTVNGWEAFYGEGSFLYQCKARFGDEKGFQVWETCNKMFDCMPLAAIVDDSIFCVHGGIPCPTPPEKDGDSNDTRIDRIRKVRCPIDIHPPMPGENDPDNELAFSLLWADPADPSMEDSLDVSENGFAASARGGGTVVFGNKAVLDFLDTFRLNYIMRAHEATANGVAVCKSAKVLTVFSTSKDHGCGGDAKCGCFLVDRSKIQAITRSPEYQCSFQSHPNPPLPPPPAFPEFSIGT